MPEFKAKLFEITLDKGRFSKELDKAIKTQMRNAARAFVRVAAAAVPFRTGFARGVFQNILDAVGKSNVGQRDLGSIPSRVPGLSVRDVISKLQDLRNEEIGARTHPTIANIHKLGVGTLRRAAGEFASGELGIRLEYYRGSGGRILKTTQSGRQFATPVGQIFQSEGFVYNFVFNVDITYFNILEYYSTPRNRNSPWKAFQFGRATFLNYLKTVALQRLPNVNDFIIGTELKVDKSGKIRTTFGVLNRTTRFTFSGG